MMKSLSYATFLASICFALSSYNDEFSRFVKKLWSADKNRLMYNVDYRVSYQGRAPWTYYGRDYSSYPFFSYVNPAVLKKPTYKTFIALLNNYYYTIGRKEDISNAEVTEIYQFLNAVLNTPVMKEAYNFLKSKGKVSYVPSQFKQKLYDLWFRSYWRSSAVRVPDSSGFEHVFVGEIDVTNSKVSGFHNWIQFYLQERKRAINYMGYLKKDLKNEIAMMRFKWNNQPKIIGSVLLGTSPEFEMALYSSVFLMGFKEVQVKINGQKIKITCFGINRNRSIGTCYPDIV